tara:strand:+ start:616 stop:1875 length:1260 start_codon:yes stop_codon:yes gene_type:complete
MNKVISILDKHILVDGFHVVADLEKSKGSWVVDAGTGKRYLDCYSQFASQALGWNCPRLQEHIAELGVIGVHKLANSDMYSEQYAKFVDAFASITPDFQHYFFIDGGALGVENALKAAFDWKAQKLGGNADNYIRTLDNHFDVIHLREAFHGRTGYTMSLTNTGNLKTRWFPKFGWTRITNPKIKHPADDASAARIEQISIKEAEIALKAGHVAAIILEPIQGEGGDNHFRIPYFKMLRELADRYEAMLIFDEVQTGLGMTGKMWCYEHFGVVPDMMCFGKKTQVCGFASTHRIDEVKDNVFNLSGRINSTWGGNLVDMVRATHIFQIIKDRNLVANAADVGAYFLDQLRDLGLENARGRGLIVAFDLESEEKRDEVMAKLNENMLALKCGSKSIRFRPHLSFSKEDVDTALGFIKSSI